MIIVDENIDQYLIEILKEKEWEIYSIREQNPGIEDELVIEQVKAHQGMLVTEDKDFGELVFAHGQSFPGISVIFLKSDKMPYSKIEEELIKAIKQCYGKSKNYFITIDKNKMRVTSL